MKIKKLIYGLLGAGGVLVACDKIEEGYMSSNIYYVTDPFTVEPDDLFRSVGAG